jgi:hypothetical protein
MKPMLVFVLAMLTLVLLMSSFDVHLGSTISTINVNEDMLGQVLYVCPAQSNGWDSAANILKSMKTGLWIGMFFAVTMLVFYWGWILYQSLLKDKFDRNMYVKPWNFTKVLFWVMIIFTLVTHTPNHYRIVHVRGYDGDLVLCENNTPNKWPDVFDGRWPKAAHYKSVTE